MGQTNSMKLFTYLNKKFDPKLLTPFWKKRSKALEKALKILHETIIIGDTFEMVANTKKYLQHIKNYNMLSEGFQKSKMVIEWGGGLGRMAEIIKRKYQNINTYIMVDIPIMTYLQARYFASKKIKVNVITSPKHPIYQGINLVALPFLGNINHYPDMFISTWGISESGFGSLEYASEHRFFDCKYLLIAHNKFELEEFPDSPLYGIVNCLKVEIDEDNEYIIR